MTLKQLILCRSALAQHQLLMIGMSTSIYTNVGGANLAIGFAIPSNLMKDITAQIVKFGTVRRGLLCITGRTSVYDTKATAFPAEYCKGVFALEAFCVSSYKMAPAEFDASLRKIIMLPS